jgi:hypothetical protein
MHNHFLHQLMKNVHHHNLKYINQIMLSDEIFHFMNSIVFSFRNFSFLLITNLSFDKFMNAIRSFFLKNSRVHQKTFHKSNIIVRFLYLWSISVLCNRKWSRLKLKRIVECEHQYIESTFFLFVKDFLWLSITSSTNARFEYEKYSIYVLTWKTKLHVIFESSHHFDHLNVQSK